MAETITNDNVMVSSSSVVTSPTGGANAATYNNGEFESYIACYPYESAEIGDLVFTVGEQIKVIKKDGDWWTGVIGTRTGIFPSNYVQPLDGADAAAADSTADSTDPTDYYSAAVANAQNGNGGGTHEDISPQPQKQIHAMLQQEEAKNQEEADTEVSEINTQQSDRAAQETFSRPMSTVSTTVIIQKYKF